MKLLLSHRFFWPDTSPYALMLRAMGDHFASAGHKVQVLTSVPSYRDGAVKAPRRERLGSLDVRRAWVFSREKARPFRRFANIILYCSKLFGRILHARPDIVIASTFPPVIAAWTASFAARLTGARFVYHMQDIHPEVSQISGHVLGKRLPARISLALDNQTLRRSAAIVVLSEDMAATLGARGLGALPIRVINNFSLSADTAQSHVPPESLEKPGGVRRLIFAGNLGRFQNLAALTEGISRLFGRYPDLELMFLGDGSAKAALERDWGGHPQVKFAPFLPFSQAQELIRTADVGLVALAPGIYRVAYPSKLLTYAQLGVAVLALVEPESALARDIRERGLGVVPKSDDPRDIAEALDELLASADRREALAAFAADTAQPSVALSRWDALLKGLGSEKGGSAAT
ncbi:glycosyltransferase family 4 protein [Rhodovulum sp. YNF3179]|uniref:glycosyltransferase family 4 protein n=1 Tax=Rhodovulum sp. YNF3179 TaxID=3425127 RepID=UPI003D340C56